ncbi:hypothetical protein JQ596_39150 [Bradyrhizobium manausense]|nr:hypothetical protein [Bradyrhizobium manausense]UVO28745.1 hypothetical protein KUF59_41010 [Bradyrhizobium arachidis]
MSFTLSQKFWSRAQIGPSSLELGECLGMSHLCFGWIAGLKADLLLAFADKLAEIVRYSFSELIDPGFRVLPWT